MTDPAGPSSFQTFEPILKQELELAVCKNRGRDFTSTGLPSSSGEPGVTIDWATYAKYDTGCARQSQSFKQSSPPTLVYSDGKAFGTRPGDTCFQLDDIRIHVPTSYIAMRYTSGGGGHSFKKSKIVEERRGLTTADLEMFEKAALARHVYRCSGACTNTTTQAEVDIAVRSVREMYLNITIIKRDQFLEEQRSAGSGASSPSRR